MNDFQKLLTQEQHTLRTEFAARYGIDPDEITFFTDQPEPFFSYEATCVILNILRPDLQVIDMDKVETGFVDTLTFRCKLIFADGRMRSAVGVVNTNELIDGKPMSSQQLQQTASARAIRNALRTAGIDLVRAHHDGVGRGSKTNFAALIAHAHILGKEVGLIDGDDKSLWRSLLGHRYGVSSTSQLGEELLADFVATLKAMRSNNTVRQAA